MNHITSNVVALPTAASAPIAQASWRGRYPKDRSIVPIWRAKPMRYARERQTVLADQIATRHATLDKLQQHLTMDEYTIYARRTKDMQRELEMLSRRVH